MQTGFAVCRTVKQAAMKCVDQAAAPVGEFGCAWVFSRITILSLCVSVGFGMSPVTGHADSIVYLVLAALVYLAVSVSYYRQRQMTIVTVLLLTIYLFQVAIEKANESPDLLTSSGVWGLSLGCAVFVAGVYVCALKLAGGLLWCSDMTMLKKAMTLVSYLFNVTVSSIFLVAASFALNNRDDRVDLSSLEPLAIGLIAAAGVLRLAVSAFIYLVRKHRSGENKELLDDDGEDNDGDSSSQANK